MTVTKKGLVDLISRGVTVVSGVVISAISTRVVSIWTVEDSGLMRCSTDTTFSSTELTSFPDSDPPPIFVFVLRTLTNAMAAALADIAQILTPALFFMKISVCLPSRCQSVLDH
ncbi:hypothetical protein GN244_ATG09033 [Phytophthora infestans]|uniref:Uncharacterized protein n=1 Tax=Phytophthora infestans TaxID=4787 RepID=A0A833T7S3_PHYIN|nr:hypothetical protein GN244_ATG09033 [Phytophthora infestans]KAF4132539.1 hypothetical protein GN958_ATG18269 [Phytophthora infestans]